MKTYGVIPARLESTRLPRKVLLDRTGYPLVYHTYQNVKKAASIDEVVIATDSDEVHRALIDLGCNCRFTGRHSSGTSRIAELVTDYSDASIFVNVQADEPELDSDAIDLVVGALKAGGIVDVATLACRIDTIEDVKNPNIVKVVVDHCGRAVYFSRSPIPAVNESKASALLKEGAWLRHIGIYAYRKYILDLFDQFSSGHPAEELENLEQLRLLLHGVKFAVVLVNDVPVGIDTEEDYKRFVQRYLKQTETREAP